MNKMPENTIENGPGNIDRRTFVLTFFGAPFMFAANKAESVLNKFQITEKENSIESERNPIKVLYLGDSNLDGSDAPYDYVKNRSAGEEDFSSGELLAQRNFPFPIEIVQIPQGARRVSPDGSFIDNNSLATTFEYLTDQVIRQIKEIGKIDVLVVALGTNDAIENIAPETFIENFTNFFRTILKSTREPWEHLVIIAPPDMKEIRLADGSYFISPQAINLVKEYRQKIKERFSWLSHIIDINDDLPSDEYLQKPDNVHLNESGQKAIAMRLERLLIRLYPKKPRNIFGFSAGSTEA